MENQQETLQLDLENHYETATTGQRFANHLLDTLILYVIFFLIVFILGITFPQNEFIQDQESPSATLLFYLLFFTIYIAYYTFFELKKTKTIGKMATKTHVIRQDGLPLTLRNCFLRSLAHIVPFEAFTAFSSDGVMWHDSWNETYVVKDKKF